MKGTRWLFSRCSTLSCFPCSSLWGNGFPKCPSTGAHAQSRCPAAGVTWEPQRSSPLLDSAELLIPLAFNITYLNSKRSNFCSFRSFLCYEEIYTELQIFKGQIQRGGPFPWLDFPSMPSVTCQQTAGAGTWRGLRDRDTFPKKHTVKWLLGDPDLQRQVGTSWAGPDCKRDALAAASTGAGRGERNCELEKPASLRQHYGREPREAQNTSQGSVWRDN